MTSLLTRPTSFQKPTHLHSHLLFCNRTDHPQKSKRECKPTHPDRATIQCKRGRTLLRTDRRAACNSTYKKLAVQWSADSFVVNQSLVLRINICGKNRQLLIAAKRYKQC
jgi:hypothetical protein